MDETTPHTLRLKISDWDVGLSREQLVSLLAYTTRIACDNMMQGVYNPREVKGRINEAIDNLLGEEQD